MGLRLNHLCRGVHRTGFPLSDRHARGHHAGDLPGFRLGRAALATGMGLQFASVVALTVSFGLGL